MQFLENAKFDWMEMLNFYERPFKASFVPAKVWTDLDRYRNDPKGLSNYFRKWRTKIEWGKLKKPSEYIWVGGEYSPDDRQCTIKIYTTKFKTHKFTQKSWDRFKFRVIQVAMHEFIHCKQYYGKPEEYAATKVYYSKTGVKRIDDNRDYHAGRDEIEAYAHCVYLDFKTKRPTIPIGTLIRYAKTYKVSKNLSGIQKVFKTDKHNEVIPLLLRKILVWERKYNRCLT